MFKKGKKVTINFRWDTAGSSGKLECIELNKEEVFEYLKELQVRFGKLVIEDVSEDNEVVLTTEEAIRRATQTEQLDEIIGRLKNYIVKQNNKREVFGIYYGTELVETFTSNVKALFRKKKLDSEKGTTDQVYVVDSFYVDPIEYQRIKEKEKKM